MQRRGQAAGQLRQRGLQFPLVASLDNSQHGFRLGQVQTAGEKRAQGELARFRKAGSGRAQRAQGRVQ